MKTGRTYSDKERLEKLTIFLPSFTSPGFVFAKWLKHEQKEANVHAMPYLDYAPLVDEFIQACYDFGWVKPGFDWPSWANTSEAANLRDNPAILASATMGQLENLLCTLIRQERFVDGALFSAYDSGLINAILLRIQSLLEEAHP